MRIPPSTALSGLLLLLSASARAQTATDHDKAVALFDDARKLIEQHDCDNAVLKLEQSIQYEPSVGAQLSLADCQESHSPLEAWKHLREAQRLAYLHHDERTKVAADRAAALEGRLPIVHVVIPAAVLQQPGLELRVDGAIVDRFFYETGMLAMPAGAHVIEASTPGERWSHEVVAQAGATTAVTVQLEPLVKQGGAPPVDPNERGRAQRTIGFVVAAIGLGGLAVGGIFGAAALVKKSDIDASCGGSSTNCGAPPGSVDAAVSDQQTFTHISTIGFIAGGVLVAGGFLLYLTSPHAHAPVAVTGSFDGRSGALELVGRF